MVNVKTHLGKTLHSGRSQKWDHATMDEDTLMEGGEGGDGQTAGKKGNKAGNEHKIKADKVYFFDYNTVEAVR